MKLKRIKESGDPAAAAAMKRTFKCFGGLNYVELLKCILTRFFIMQQ
jgi:hypothetical protein